MQVWKILALAVFVCSPRRKLEDGVDTKDSGLSVEKARGYTEKPSGLLASGTILNEKC
jgi:hypothetical protein